MSSKGQVVIPEAIRKALGLDAGAEVVAVAENDVVILKIIQAPTRGSSFAPSSVGGGSCSLSR
jgi:AbrB family looped-hinge helix DNA binding protein